MDREQLLAKMQLILEKAKAQNAKITKEEVQAFFEKEKIDEVQLEAVYAYLDENHIMVKGFVPSRGLKEMYDLEEEELASEKIKESKYLKMYRKDLNKLEVPDKENRKELYKELLDGKEAAKQEVTHAWLKKVITIAKGYMKRADGIILDDLIQEGNIGLLLCVEDLFGSKQDVDCESVIRDFIKKTMETYLDENQILADQENTIIAKENLLAKAMKTLSEDLGRVATVSELSEYTKMTEEEIEDLMRLSKDSMKAGKGE
ncbi:MAG: hypothetical protein K6G65_05395 [Lachnospiraceae bacterium]|nr:hypothetical protein [Lachnospiraceae bacterium]